MYDEQIRLVVLDALDNKTSSTASIIRHLDEQGYIPNKNKYVMLRFATMLTDAFDNIHIFSKEQQQNLERLFNKVISL